MPVARMERLVNLTVTLMNARRPVTVAQLASTVYEVDDPQDEAFRRMFERDKEALREQGVPLTTEGTDGHDDEVGYRIPPQDYKLPDIDLSADEAAALALAARLWSSASLAAPAGAALRKLEAAGIDVDPDTAVAFEPRLAGSGPLFDALFAATSAGRTVRFDYRSERDAAPSARTVEPWGLVSWRGRWYLVGYDRDREAQRTFRLSRMTSDVELIGKPGAVKRPADIDLRANLTRYDVPVERNLTARLRLAPGRAHAVRRSALSADGDEVTLAYANVEGLAEWLVTFGPDLVVLDPPDLVDAVVRRLRALVGRSAVVEPA